MSDILESLFGSRAKLRILRSFLLNPGKEYSVADIAEKNMLKSPEVRKEINKLKKIELVKESTKKRRKYYRVNSDFALYHELKSLIAKSNIFPQCKSMGKAKSVGEVKLLLTSGIFLNYPKSKADILLVANSVSRAKLNTFIKNLEAEVGKEVRYVLISSDELNYRINMLDRFLLDFFRDPHEEIINNIPKLSKFIKNLKR